MRHRIHAVVFPNDTSEFAPEIRRIFPEVGETEALVSECSPPLDVYETDDAVEISVDLPGVDPQVLHVVVKGESVLIAGSKAPRRGQSGASFHLVERGYGRFVRTVRLSGACDAGRARATLQAGELRIRLPKIADRRGIAVPITVVKPS
jgi:HSP20 family protein